MPFTGPQDSSLPDRIKKMSATKRRQFVAVFNSSHAKCKRDGGTDRACESVAFRNANGVVKEIDMETTEVAEEVETTDEGQKDTCEKCHAQPCACVTEVNPLGGATSLADARTFLEAQETRMSVSELVWQFRTVVDNIWNQEEVSADQKATQTVQLATELADRVALPNLGKEAGTLDKIKDFVFGEKVSKKEGGVDFKASDYADVPDAEKPSTWKLRLAEKRSGNFTVEQVARAITALQPGGFRGQRVKLGQPKAAVTGKISAAIGKITGASNDQKKTLKDRLNRVKEHEDNGGFYVTKDKDGAWRWLAVVTNRFEDRDGEIFSEAAHKEFESYLDRTAEYPELRLWHIPGSGMGRADFWTYADGFVVSSGKFYKGYEDVAESLSHSEEELAVSHGYAFDPGQFKNGVYGQYRTFEVSVLPSDVASNPWTSFSSLTKEEVSMLSDRKRAILAEHYGEEKAGKIEDALSNMDKALEDAGLSFKDVVTGEEDTQGAGQQAPESTTEVAPTTDEEEEKPTEKKPEEEPATDTPESPSTEGVAEAVKAAVGPIMAKLTEIATTQADHATQLEALKQSDDTKVAERMSPKGKDMFGKTVTNGSGNVVGEDVVEKITGSKEGEPQELPENPAKPYVEHFLSSMGEPKRGA